MNGRSAAHLPSSADGGARSLRIAATGPARAKQNDGDDWLSGDMEKELGKHEDLGELKTHCEIAGKSGVPHRFSFGYEKTPEFTVVADVVVQDGPVDETKVLSLFIKVFDTGVKHSMLCVTPSLTPEAKKLAGLYRIVIVESSGRKNLPSLISEALNRISSM